MSSTLANHYIRPEDLSPLPTTLDAKKSPLALLAQTCSNIGADLSPNSKPLITLDKSSSLPSSLSSRNHHRSSLERSESVCSDKNNSNEASSRSNSESSSETRISFKPYESKCLSNGSVLDSNDNLKSNSINVIDNNKKLSSLEKDYQQNHHQHHHHRSKSDNKSVPSDLESNGHSKCVSSSSSSKLSLNNSTAISYTSSGSAELSKSQLTPLPKSDSLSTVCKTTSSLASCINGYSGYSGLNANSPLPSLHADLLKASTHYSSALLSPYINHHAALSSLKAAQAAAGGSVCRDPFCKGCQFSATAALSATLPCSNNCNGCTHPHLPPGYLPPSLAHLTSAASFANAGSSTLQNSRSILRCDWTVSGSFCGKTFSSCEELLQHLKTHTSIGNSNPFTSLESFYNPAAAAAAAAAALPNSLSSLTNLRNVPTHSSFDSLRYHPYKLYNSGISNALNTGLHLPSPQTHISALSGAGLSSYYPSYGLYNGRL